MVNHVEGGPEPVQEKSELPISTTPSSTNQEVSHNVTQPMNFDLSAKHEQKHAGTLGVATGAPITPACTAHSLVRSTTATNNDDDDFPDGGWAAWSCVFGAWCAFFCTFGMFNSAGVFVQIYHDGILNDTSLALITWIPAVQAFAMDSSMAVFGRAFDAYGPRWLLYIGTIVFIFGSMMTSISTQYYQFVLAQGVVSGIGQSCLSTTIMACTITWFRRRRAVALATAISGSAVGGIIIPIILTQLTPHLGFSWAMRVVTFMCLGLSLIACGLVKSRIKPKTEPLLLNDYTSSFQEMTMLLLFAGFFLLFGGIFVPASYILVQAQDAGVDASLVGYILPIWNLASIPGRILAGLLADVTGNFNTATLILGASMLLTLCLWLPGVHNQEALIAYSVLYGFVSGSVISLAPACVAQVSKIHQVGTRTGVAFAIGGVGGLVSPPIAGMILEAMRGNNYIGLQLFCGLEILGGMLCLGAARILQGGWRWTKI